MAKKSKKVIMQEMFLKWVSNKEGQLNDKALLNKAHKAALDEVISLKLTNLNLLQQKAAAFILSLSDKEAKSYDITEVQETLKANVYRLLCKGINNVSK